MTAGTVHVQTLGHRSAGQPCFPRSCRTLRTCGGAWISRRRRATASIHVHPNTAKATRPANVDTDNHAHSFVSAASATTNRESIGTDPQQVHHGRLTRAEGGTPGIRCSAHDITLIDRHRIAISLDEPSGGRPRGQLLVGAERNALLAFADRPRHFGYDRL